MPLYPPAPTGTQQEAPPCPAPRWAHLDDAAVLAAGLDGERDAWDELVKRYGRLVFSIPRRYGFERDGCEEIFQEVFVIFTRQAPSIRRRSGLPKWFITTTHRVCRQWFDRRRRGPCGLPEPLRSPLPPPQLLELWERQHLVRRALEQLGGRCQELLVALYTDQGPPRYGKVAGKLGIPEGSIGPTRSRCLQKLLGLLEAMERPDPR